MCVTTARDGLVTDFTGPELVDKMLLFRSLEADQAKEQFGLEDKDDWTVAAAQDQMRTHDVPSLVRPYLFRPFDTRAIYYSNAVVKRPVEDLFGHFTHRNIAILTIQTSVKEEPYRCAFVTRCATNKKALSTEANCYAFPLYPYDDTEARSNGQQVAPLEVEGPTRPSNIRREVLDRLSGLYSRRVTAEEVFHYTYAMLNAQGYRETYYNQLPVDFPHVPFPWEVGHFSQLSGLGEQLALAHLQEALADVPVRFQSAVDNKIEAKAIRYTPEAGRVEFNTAGASFSGVTPGMWDYHIGSYRPLERWLEERDGRHFVLDYSETAAREVLVDDYRAVARAIAGSLPVHREIDALWEAMVGHEGMVPIGT
jgi:hypothetical protein